MTKDTRWTLYLLEGGLGTPMHMEGHESGRFVADREAAVRMAHEAAVRHWRPVTIVAFRFHPPSDPARLAVLLNDLPSHGITKKIPNVTRTLEMTVPPTYEKDDRPEWELRTGLREEDLP